jgi:hypothetical protein
MNTVTPQTTTPPALVPAGAATTKPALPTSKPPAPLKAKCDTFTRRPLTNFELMLRNVFYGTLPVNPPTSSPCPSN